jgi:O-acetyl-ADP-ribose deacetylase (regulator of RNase III)
MQHDECLHEKIGIFVGDIVRLQVDGIVNAANRNLEPGVAAKSNLNDHHIAGSGVCGAIHRAAGPRLSIDCRALAPCETGHAVATYAYKLPSKMVIHTVGPEYEDRQMLSACYTNSLDVAVYYEMKTIVRHHRLDIAPINAHIVAGISVYCDGHIRLSS